MSKENGGSPLVSELQTNPHDGTDYTYLSSNVPSSKDVDAEEISNAPDGTPQKKTILQMWVDGCTETM